MLLLGVLVLGVLLLVVVVVLLMVGLLLTVVLALGCLGLPFNQGQALHRQDASEPSFYIQQEILLSSIVSTAMSSTEWVVIAAVAGFHAAATPTVVSDVVRVAT